MDHGVEVEKNQIGVFLRISTDETSFYQTFFEDRLENMKSELSPEIRIESPEGKDGWAEALFLSVRLDDIDTLDMSTEDLQLK